MALDAFSLVAFFESSYNPTAQNSKSTSSGLFGMLNSTWQTSLKGIGIDPSQYASEKDAPASVQFAAEAWLLNNHGFSDYTCPGCDPALAAALQADGGASAFNLGHLSTDPASYANVDTADGLKSYFADNGGGTVTETLPDGQQITLPTWGTPGSSITSVETTSGLTPFSWLWNAYQNGVKGTLASMEQTVQGNAYGNLGPLLVLDAAILGITVLYGMTSSDRFWSKLFRAAFVVALLGVDNLFNGWIVAFFSDFPNTAGRWLGLANTGPSAFDTLLQQFFVQADAALNIPLWTTAFWASLVFVALAELFFLPAIGVMFLTFWLSQALTELLFVFGPLLVLTLLFDRIRHIFDGWLNELAHLALTAFAAVVLASLTLNLMSGMLGGVTTGTGTTAGGQRLLAVSLAIFGFGTAVSVLPWILSHITRGAVGAPSIWRHSGATTVANAPSTAAGAVATGAVVALGAAMLSPVSITRPSMSAGPSLSRG